MEHNSIILCTNRSKNRDDEKKEHTNKKEDKIWYKELIEVECRKESKSEKKRANEISMEEKYDINIDKSLKKTKKKKRWEVGWSIRVR